MGAIDVLGNLGTTIATTGKVMATSRGVNDDVGASQGSSLIGAKASVKQLQQLSGQGERWCRSQEQQWQQQVIVDEARVNIDCSDQGRSGGAKNTAPVWQRVQLSIRCNNLGNDGEASAAAAQGVDIEQERR
ncbi:hypothetical protein NL676_007126 [Syzygium grande]|nr:hypothetical protein NL676_007126 [Syzygium grande]